MTTLKQWMDQQWRNPGVQFAGNGAVYMGTCLKDMQVRGGSNRTYKSKEQKAYEARFGIYNKKLVPIILAEATRDDRFSLPRYSWPKEAHTPAPAVESVPRKRVSHKKVTQAAAILAKVPEGELTAFLARFGLSLSLAASIAS